mmetsp:Transcript_55748/g.122023  ORF Transcript_55748/g.122023 Transcript_55748/m.122023 type:complete len:215 (-) Transcript_55748:1940-2584(-)
MFFEKRGLHHPNLSDFDWFWEVIHFRHLETTNLNAKWNDLAALASPVERCLLQKTFQFCGLHLLGVSLEKSDFVLVVFLVVAEKFSNFGSMHDHLLLGLEFLQALHSNSHRHLILLLLTPVVDQSISREAVHHRWAIFGDHILRSLIGAQLSHCPGTCREVIFPSGHVLRRHLQGHRTVGGVLGHFPKAIVTRELGHAFQINEACSAFESDWSA